MAHTHEYDCKLCGAHLDSKDELDRHNVEHHGRSASGGSNINNVSGSSNIDRSSGGSSGSSRSS